MLVSQDDLPQRFAQQRRFAEPSLYFFAQYIMHYIVALFGVSPA